MRKLNNISWGKFVRITTIGEVKNTETMENANWHIEWGKNGILRPYWNTEAKQHFQKGNKEN